MDKQAIWGLLLCSVAILVYYLIFLPWLFPPQRRPVQPQPAKEAEVKTPAPAVEPAVKIEKSELVPAPPSEVPIVDNILLENDLLKTTWTNEGAALKDAILKKYKDYRGGERLCLIEPSEASPPPMALEEVLGKYDLSKRIYQVKEITPNRISLQTTLEEGLRLTKILSLQEGRYHVDVEIILENISQAELPVRYTVVSSSQICLEGTPAYDMASVVGVDVGGGKIRLIQKTLSELVKSPERNESHGIAWAGGVNRYFASVLKAGSNDWVYAVNSRPVLGKDSKDKTNLLVNIETANFTLPPQGAERHAYQFFMGPKREEVLKDYKLETLLGFGAFTPLSKGLLQILNAFYAVIPNYGVDIIILTFLVKIVLFPLTRKSQMSMYKMQKLQPLLEQLREKYKKDKQKMGQEQMALFKKHGVNPMSGCLPIVLQLPIFYALFRTLQLSFEMRQAPFILWMQDLSQPDRMLTLNFALPFLGNDINALPIIMTAASVFQMRLMPKSTDPAAQQQQKLMKYMPIMFAFVLYHMPSGLVLYWTVSTILSIGEQLLIKRMLSKAT
jgi:YidC/Oxa1 family membrane protein insertase